MNAPEQRAEVNSPQPAAGSWAPSHIGLTLLRERGWTAALVRDFLGDPDKLKPNPNGRSLPPMRLYARTRVDAAESTPEFAERLTRARAASERARKVAEGKRASLLAQVEAVPVDVPVVDLAELAWLAVENWNVRAMARADACGEDWERAEVASVDPETLARWMVNYVRHGMTDYDTMLDGVVGMVGVDDAAEAIRRRVLVEIAGVYPTLAAECSRQASDWRREHA